MVLLFGGLFLFCIQNVLYAKRFVCRFVCKFSERNYLIFLYLYSINFLHTKHIKEIRI